MFGWQREEDDAIGLGSNGVRQVGSGPGRKKERAEKAACVGGELKNKSGQAQRIWTERILISSIAFFFHFKSKFNYNINSNKF
jgi:hypothetical protein